MPYVALIESLCPRDVITGWRLAREGVNPRDSRGSYPPPPPDTLVLARANILVPLTRRGGTFARDTHERPVTAACLTIIICGPVGMPRRYRVRQIGSRISPRARIVLRADDSRDSAS